MKNPLDDMLDVAGRWYTKEEAQTVLASLDLFRDFVRRSSKIWAEDIYAGARFLDEQDRERIVVTNGTGFWLADAKGRRHQGNPGDNLTRGQLATLMNDYTWVGTSYGYRKVET